MGPDASHATNKPWKTIAKLLGAAGFASGDTAYLSPAGPFREVVTVAMTSATAETQIIGDPANAQRFKTSGGVLVTPGDVIWTAYTTDDTTTPSTSALLNLAGRDYLTFKNLMMIAGNVANGGICDANTAHSTNITFRDIVSILTSQSGNGFRYTGAVDTAANWIIDRCKFLGSSSGNFITITLPTTATAADYDVNFLIQNCRFDGPLASGSVINIATSGANSNKGGGVDVFNCVGTCGRATFMVTAANVSATIPCTVYNSIILAGNATALSAGVSGQIVEDYNRILASTPRTNVTAGGSSISDLSHALLVEIGQADIMGRMLRPFMMPMAGSPLLGRGNQAGGPTVDILNRPRPAGGGSTSYAWGAYERHDTLVRETSVVDAGSNAGKIVGPGDQDYPIPVDAVSTTLSIRVRYDTNHAATNKPQATILNGEEIGVATETKTATVGVDTYETLTFSAFTPTARGIITLRLISRSAAGNGIAYFDTLGVT